MGLLKGATSLVEMIVKKFGDDIDGATQELVRMGGFPEPVARRIATGELPMDEASRVAAQEREAQTHPETYIHGSKSGGILEIDPEKSGATNPNARGTGFWGSDNPYQAGTYTGALGEGGTLYPIRVKRGEQIDVDLNGSHWNNIDTEARITSNGEDYGSIEAWDDSAYDTNDLAFMFQDAGADSLLMRNTIDTATDGNINVVFEEMFPELKKMPWGSKERYEFMQSISQEDFQKAKNIANERSARPSNNVVVFDENSIRSPNAAYDPQYNGPNIMGNATVPMLGATALGSAGLLAAPALVKGGVFQHGATSEPVVERKEPVRNQSGLLESVTDFGDEVFKSVRHSAGPVADVLMPFEGVNNYLKVVNDYDRQPTWMDRLGLLDW